MGSPPGWVLDVWVPLTTLSFPPPLGPALGGACIPFSTLLVHSLAPPLRLPSLLREALAGNKILSPLPAAVIG